MGTQENQNAEKLERAVGQGVHNDKSYHRLLLPQWIFVPNMTFLQL